MSVRVTRTAQASWFAKLAQQTKDTRPVSRALAGAEITLKARLAGH